MDSPPIKIREATAADAPRLAELLRQLGYDRSSTDLARALPGKDGVVLVAVRSKKVLGLLALQVRSYFHLAEPVGSIDMLVVDRAARSSGIGHALLAAAANEAGRQGCVTVELHSNRKRRRARQFYEREGFVVTSNHFTKTLTRESHALH